MAEKLGKSDKGTGIHPDVLKSLVSQCNGVQSEMDESRGDLGSKIKNAEDTHGVHRKAFKQVCTLARMDEGKRSEYLRALDDYREKLDLSPHPDMFEDGEGDEAERRAKQAAKADGDDRAAENGKALKGGIKQLEAVH